MKSIPYGRQEISESDIEAVVGVLRSDYLTQGPVVPRFERAVADYCGAQHAVAACNGTSALHLACLGLGVGPGKLVWTSPISFVASANCARYCGAEVDFVDIDPSTWNLSLVSLTRKLAEAEKSGTLPDVLIPVHLAGQSCQMAEIHALAQKYGFRIIEDASHAVGARYRQLPVGSCRWSDATVFSFHPVKVITTGEGGMVMTNDAEVASRMSMLRTHGVTRDPGQMSSPPDGPWYYEQKELGFNYRMMDLQAALGLSQLQRLNSFVERRRAIADRYDSDLADLPFSLPPRHPDTISSWHLYIVRTESAASSDDHKRIFESLQAMGLAVNLHYIPIYRHPYYRALGFKPVMYPEAEAYYRSAITIPMYAGLLDEEQTRVMDALRQAVSGLEV